ncbi:bola-like protein-domain-containing protein [Melampsora americana]|nr:bola-like protein-domain-containing protein [Melampsora americana]
MINQPNQNSISIQESITRKLKELLKPITLEVINESHLHSHHSAMRAIGGGSGETHFSIRVISTEFIGLNRLSRHRMIYNSLEDEFKNRGLHALSLQTFTPDELST